MSAERKFLASARTAQSKGPVQLRFVESEKGATLEIAVDYERADVPERRYYADFCSVVKARSGYSFTFGRLTPGANALRTKVEISFPESLFVEQLWKSSRKLYDTLEREVDGKLLPPIGADFRDTDTVQGFRANNVFMSMLGDDSVMDFYYIAPPDIHFARTGRRSDVYLEPIIRIALPTALMYEFLQQCKLHLDRMTNVTEQSLEQKE
jgi:hypothetical protein